MGVGKPDDRQTVWVLGAGFSKALGGPLINDLLAFRGEGVIRSLYPVDVYNDLHAEMWKARLFFNHGKTLGYRFRSLRSALDKRTILGTLLIVGFVSKAKAGL